MNLLHRYWQGLSPALRRYYRASLWPSLTFVVLAVLHEWAARAAVLPTAARIGIALAPALCMGWMFACYLRFLRDCGRSNCRKSCGGDAQRERSARGGETGEPENGHELPPCILTCSRCAGSSH